ncbi:MAG: pyrimidine/purine nucleoside phosphorylase [Spirochaetales bacterium]|nr:pyrimidine/purine nucleoside phosphorylase [Spirochaetales bacterium]
MSDFKNVTIVKKANIYFSGKVTSRTIIFNDSSKKTLGIMLPGEYEFKTEDKEIMEIIQGSLDILLPGHTDWEHIESGQSFSVPPHSLFKLKVNTITDYCCSYLKE